MLTGGLTVTGTGGSVSTIWPAPSVTSSVYWPAWEAWTGFTVKVYWSYPLVTVSPSRCHRVTRGVAPPVTVAVSVKDAPI